MAGKTTQSNTASSSVIVEETPEQTTFQIRLPKLKGENAQQTEFYSVNGKNFLLKRGEYINVPRELYEVILNSQNAEEDADRYAESVAVREPR